LSKANPADLVSRGKMKGDHTEGETMRRLSDNIRERNMVNGLSLQHSPGSPDKWGRNSAPGRLYLTSTDLTMIMEGFTRVSRTIVDAR
jgi:hypothetical protein